ncbi:POK19 protein, partial [Illadopsis cleaveri]|nr:POK19 protein [Illadopsis cleaveri]
VEHKTGIPYSLTGQAIMERAHQNIKRVLNQQEQILKNEPPSIKLSRALFTLNFLNCSFDTMNPPVTRHFRGSARLAPHERPKVLVRDPETLRTQGPFDLVPWG